MRIAFLGAGQMATALAKGFTAADLLQASDLIATDISPDSLSRWQKATGGRVAKSAADALHHAEVVFLAVKPQSLESLLATIAPAVSAQHLLVSIVAGVSTERITKLLAHRIEKPRLIRVMPNTPCLVQSAASALSASIHASAEDCETVRHLMSAVGLAVEVPESLLDAVTGLSGSGSAFVFTIIEALADGGVKAGLPRAIANRLAAQTVLGAAKMVVETGIHPAELKDQVASPAGTTIAGLAVLERAAVRSGLIDAVVAATNRAKELGQ